MNGSFVGTDGQARFLPAADGSATPTIDGATFAITGLKPIPDDSLARGVQYLLGISAEDPGAVDPDRDRGMTVVRSLLALGLSWSQIIMMLQMLSAFLTGAATTPIGGTLDTPAATLTLGSIGQKWAINLHGVREA